MLQSKKILFILSGSIAAFKACAVISKLKQAGHSLKVVATPASLNFIGKATLEGLSGERVQSDLYQDGSMMDHIYLQRWADLIIVAPASANFINKMAQGIGDDLASTIFLAHDFSKPFLIAPAMNTKMYLHPITQTSVQKLKQLGVGILESASGVLACGETGLGRLLEADQLVAEIELALGKAQLQIPEQSATRIPTKARRIFITGGGTQVDIDGVRVLANRSTGKTSLQISRELFALGFDVTLLCSEQTPASEQEGFCVERYRTYDQFAQKFRHILSHQDFDVIFHAAAVSDFSVETSDSKLASGQEQVLKLKPTAKLLTEVRALSKNKSIKIIGFKLTHTRSEEERKLAVEKLFSVSHPDFVIQNEMSEISNAGHPFRIYGSDLTSKKDVLGISDLVLETLNRIFSTEPRKEKL